MRLRVHTPQHVLPRGQVFYYYSIIRPQPYLPLAFISGLLLSHCVFSPTTSFNLPYLFFACSMGTRTSAAAALSWSFSHLSVLCASQAKLRGLPLYMRLYGVLHVSLFHTSKALNNPAVDGQCSIVVLSDYGFLCVAHSLHYSNKYNYETFRYSRSGS